MERHVARYIDGARSMNSFDLMEIALSMGSRMEKLFARSDLIDIIVRHPLARDSENTMCANYFRTYF